MIVGNQYVDLSIFHKGSEMRAYVPASLDFMWNSPPNRFMRSRIPVSPKCPVAGPQHDSGSNPVPLSRTEKRIRLPIQNPKLVQSKYRKKPYHLRLHILLQGLQCVVIRECILCQRVETLPVDNFLIGFYCPKDELLHEILIP